MSEIPDETAGQKLTRMSNDLAYMARGFNLDGMHDVASEAQKFLVRVIYFREQLARNELADHSWMTLMTWKPPPEDEDEKARRDRRP